MKSLCFIFASLLMTRALAAQSGDGDCQFQLEVFLDRSGSVQQLLSTGKSEYKEVLEALSGMLATSPHHLLDQNDAVQIDHFPSYATDVEILIGPEAVAKRIEQLVSQPAPSTPFTDLTVPFGWVRDRAMKPSSAHRRLFLVVSDFLHDPQDASKDFDSFVWNFRADFQRLFPVPMAAGTPTIRAQGRPLPLAGSQASAPVSKSFSGENILLLYTTHVSERNRLRQQLFLASLTGIHYQILRDRSDLEKAIIEHSFRLASEVAWDPAKKRQANVALVNRNCCAFTVCQVWLDCSARDRVNSKTRDFVLASGATSQPIPIDIGTTYCEKPAVGVSGHYGAAKDGVTPRPCTNPDVLPVFEELPLVGDGSPPELRTVQASYRGGWLRPGQLQLNFELRGQIEEASARREISVRAIDIDSVNKASATLPRSMARQCESSPPPEGCLDPREWHRFQCTLNVGREGFPAFAYLPLEVDWSSNGLRGAGAPGQSPADHKRLPSLSTPAFVALTIPAFFWAVTLAVILVTGETLTMSTVAALVTIVTASSFAFGINYLVNPVPGFEDIRRVLFHTSFLCVCLVFVCLLWGALSVRRHRLQPPNGLRTLREILLPFLVCFGALWILSLFFPMFVGEVRQRWGTDGSAFEEKWGPEICAQVGSP